MGEAAVKNLMLKRGNVKGRLTKHETWLNNEVFPANSTEFSSRLNIVTELYEEFLKLNSEIQILTEFDDVHEAYHDEFELKYINVQSRLREHIDERIKTTASTGSVRNNNSVTKRLPIQLPMIKLPNFTGKYDEWIPFRDTFTSLINNEASISDVQRFHYLLGNLGGDARKLVDNIELSEQGYQQAWTTLVSRYDNARLIIDKHVNSILTLPPMTIESSVHLHNLIDNCVNHLTALKTLKQPVEHWDTLIVNIVSARIIGETKTLWEMSVGINEIPTWDQMLKFMNNRARVLDAIESRIVQTHSVSDVDAMPDTKSKQISHKNRPKGAWHAMVASSTSNYIICSKSRVAPLKTVTIPRLELCAALLLSRLTNKTLSAMQLTFDKIILWSDSTIVLAWIKTPVNLLKTFVASRVSEIQSLESTITWQHIDGKLNPADIISRGISPTDISTFHEMSLWWNGPPFLLQPNCELTSAAIDFSSIQIPELKIAEISLHSQTTEPCQLLCRYSSYTRLLRVTSFMLRFINNSRKSSDHRVLTPYLNSEELKASRNCLVKITQQERAKLNN